MSSTNISFMAKLSLKKNSKPKIKDETLPLPAFVKRQLDRVIDKVQNKARDFVIIVDGREGSGKSTLAFQIAKYLDPEFDIDKIFFNYDEFLEKIANVVGGAIVLDEAMHGTDSRGSMTKVNRQMRSVFSEMRQNRHYVILVMPSFFDMDKTLALWRADALFHVYFDREGDRGSFILYPNKAKSKLYIAGRKDYNYNAWHSPYAPMRFYNKWVIDELEYEKRKREAFRLRAEKKDFNNLWKSRFMMVADMFKEKNGITYREIGEKFGIRPENFSIMKNALGNQLN